MVRRTSAEIRRLSYHLHPTLLIDLGLEPALNLYFKDIRNHSGLEIDFSMVGFDHRLDVDSGNGALPLQPGSPEQHPEALRSGNFPPVHHQELSRASSSWPKTTGSVSTPRSSARTSRASACSACASGPPFSGAPFSSGATPAKAPGSESKSPCRRNPIDG